jgi:hypothetical protein
VELIIMTTAAIDLSFFVVASIDYELGEVTLTKLAVCYDTALLLQSGERGDKNEPRASHDCTILRANKQITF